MMLTVPSPDSASAAIRSANGPGSSGMKSTDPSKFARMTFRIFSASSIGLSCDERKTISSSCARKAA
jgi:hypothetical protein